MQPWLAALAMPSIELRALQPAPRRWARPVIFAAVVIAGTCAATATDRQNRVWPRIIDRISADQDRAMRAAHLTPLDGPAP